MAVKFESAQARKRLAELNYRLQTISSQGVAAKRQLREAITNAAQPIADDAKRRIHSRSGDLAASIRPNRAVLHRGGGMTVTVSTHGKASRYAGPLEYGHAGGGGKNGNFGPAPAYPYMRPAFDDKKEEAYDMIVQGIVDLMNDLGI